MAYTRPFISSGEDLDVRNGNSSRNFIHPFMTLAVVARSAPPSPSRVSPIQQNLFTHPYVSPSTTRSPSRSASRNVTSHRLHIKPSATSDKSPRTALHRLWIHFIHNVHLIEFACTPFTQIPQGHFPEFTIIFPSLLPTITLDFPVFTVSPLSRMLAPHSATRLPSCSIIEAISTKSSAYSNLEGRPHLASLETTSMTTANNSGLSTAPWCKPTFTSTLSLSPVSILTMYSTSLCIQCHNCADEPLIHTQLPQNPAHHFPWDSIKCLFQIYKAYYRFFFFAWCFSCTCHIMKITSMVPLPGMKPNYILSIDTWHLIIFQHSLKYHHRLLQ